MIEILGIKMTYDAVAFLSLFVVSEILPFIPGLKGNGIVDEFLKLTNVIKTFRSEDEELTAVKDKLHEIQELLKK